MGSLPQLSARVTLYDNSVYGNWLRQKGVAKVSGILEGSDFILKKKKRSNQLKYKEKKTRRSKTG